MEAGPGLSLFQGSESIQLNTAAQRLEEDEEQEDKKRREEEVTLFVLPQKCFTMCFGFHSARDMYRRNHEALCYIWSFKSKEFYALSLSVIMICEESGKQCAESTI